MANAGFRFRRNGEYRQASGRGGELGNFDFAFSLFAIVLGLGLTEVFGGVARAVKARPTIRIGWATSLLAIWAITKGRGLHDILDYPEMLPEPVDTVLVP